MVEERVEDLAELQAQQEPVIVRRVFNNPANAPRTSVIKTPGSRSPLVSEPFSVGFWFKTTGGEPVIHRAGTIRVGAPDEPDSQGR